jgi:hypothetical protein
VAIVDIFDTWPSKEITRKLFFVSIPPAIFFNVITALQLNKSNYPETQMIGPYPSWWFSFSGPELKSHYAMLIDRGTIDTFRIVQYLDYGLMLSTGIFLFLLTLIVSRQFIEGSFYRKSGFVAALLLAAAPIMDFLENAILLVMLSNPIDFSDWLAIAYSTFASAKVILVSMGLIMVIMLSVAIVGRLIKSKILRNAST